MGIGVGESPHSHPRRPGQHGRPGQPGGRVPCDPDPLPGQQLLPGIECLWAFKTNYRGPRDFVSDDQVIQTREHCYSTQTQLENGDLCHYGQRDALQGHTQHLLGEVEEEVTLSE